MIQIFQNDNIELNIYPNLINNQNLCETDKFDVKPYDHKYQNQTLNGIMAHNKYSQIRFLDFDRLGYPNFLINLIQNQTSTTQLYQSQICQKDEGDCLIGIQFIESKLKDKIDAIKYDNILYNTFFDLQEDGVIDLVYVIQEKENILIKFILNYIETDSFFLKILGSQKEEGTLYYGTVFMSEVTSINMNYLKAHVSTMSQSQNNQLQLPFAFQGLGRTNNYVQFLSCGMPQENENYKTWTPIIPNSQLQFIPRKMDQDRWDLNILVNPTDKLSLIIVLTTIFLAILGVIILKLMHRERKQDKQDSDQFKNVFR